MTDEARTIQERYQSATRTSNLKQGRVGATTDADVLGAAAFVPDRLGTMLFRLQDAYAGAKGEKALYEAEAFRLYQLQRQLQRQVESLRKATKPDVDAIAKKAAEVDRVADEAKRETITGRAMVLMQLKGLILVVDAVGSAAFVIARRLNLEINPEIRAAIVSRVLETFLDPNCPQCTGRKFVGGAYRGDRVEICRACGGSGSRQDHGGQSPNEKRLAFLLAGVLSVKCHEAARAIKVALRD
jgi:hypothetical protein